MFGNRPIPRRTPLGRLAAALCLGGLLGVNTIMAHGVRAGVKKVVHQYALTSANDFPQRDPRDWRLLASNNGGRTWITLDDRQGEMFEDRQQRKVYKINNETAYETYRLEIDRVRNPDVANMVQLAQLELMGLTEQDHAPQPIFTDPISSRGDNPPTETVTNLFDSSLETKWLDWMTNGPSWVQWQYADPAGTVATNISQLISLRDRAADGYRAQISAAVAGPVEGGKRICFVDSTGCVELGGVEGMQNLAIGQGVSITGASAWNGQEVALRDARVQVTSPETNAHPVRFTGNETLPPGNGLEWLQVEGEIQYRRSLQNELAFDIHDEAGIVRVHLRRPENPQVLPLSGTRVSISGLCRGAFNESGRWEPATLWCAGSGSLRILESRRPGQPATALPAQTEPAPGDSATLNSIEQIRDLSPQQIAAGPNVKVRGVVTDLHGEFLQDATAGIRVIFPVEEPRRFATFGAYIEVDGTATSGDGGIPLISASHITFLGPGKLPQPQRLSLNELMSGHVEAQWVEVEGIVRSTDGAHLLLICDGRELMATLGMAANDVVKQLVDAEIRVRGVGIAARDDLGRVQGIHLLIPSLDDVDVLLPAPDPAALPVRKLGSLLGLNGPRESFHRVKVEGVVTMQENRKVFLQDDSGSATAFFKEDVVLDAHFGRSLWLYWRATVSKDASGSNETFFPGERVQVVGFSETHRYSPVLTEAKLTRVGGPAPVNPVALTRDGIEEGGLDSRLVTFDGILQGEDTIGANTVLALQWRDRTLPVLVPADDTDAPKIALGSRVRVIGVCQVDPPPYAELGLGVGAVRIQTRSFHDLTVLDRPPWWTVRRALTVMGVMALFIIITLVWIKELRRQVEERSRQLMAEIELREQTERRRAMEQERARIAKDLHDDLGANLTQIVFLSERVETARHDGQESSRWFDLIPATARRTIRSLDEIVWAINPRHDSLESLANYLSQFAQEHLALARVRCVLDVPMVLPAFPLSAEVRHNLLLAAREALQNAVVHARATEVRLALNLDDEGVKITVSDNGGGFDPASVSQDGNGLANMQRRLQEIGGRLEIASLPGKGTTVSLFVPNAVLHGRVIGSNGVSA